jgi:hypothetical protein
MGSVNNANPGLDPTVRVYDQFYQYDASVPATEYDAVLSFFMSRLKDKTAAKNFTTSVFRISTATGTSALDILAQLESQPGIQLSATLAYYMNSLRSKTTLLGVGGVTYGNPFVSRNIRV